MRENMTNLPDVAKLPIGMGGGSARQSLMVSVLSARTFISRPYVVLLPISSDSLLII